MNIGQPRRRARPAREQRRGWLGCVVALLVAVLAAPALAADLEHARALAQRGDAAGALAELDALVAAAPDNVAARLLRSVLLSQMGRTDAAIEGFKAIARDRPDLPEPHNNLAVLYAAQGRYEEAREALRTAIDLQPDYDLAHENLGDVYAKLAALAYARAQQVNRFNERVAQKQVAAERVLEIGATGSGGEAREAQPSRQGAASPEATSIAPTQAAGCVRIAGITDAERRQRVVRWLREQDLVVDPQARTEGGARRGWRVYAEPLPDAAAATARIAELRAAGIEDLIIINDGALANGISLGVFARRGGAERRQRELAERGIESRIAPLDASPRSSDWDVLARGQADRTVFAREFPDLEITTSDCP